MLVTGEMLTNIGFPITFGILAMLPLFGVLLLRKDFTYEIPHATDMGSTKEEIELMDEIKTHEHTQNE